jgi:hypothetical protein
MPNLEPLHRDQVPELEPVLQAMQATQEFVPNSLLTLARRPEIAKAVTLTRAVLGRGALAPFMCAKAVTRLSAQQWSRPVPGVRSRSRHWR